MFFAEVAVVLRLHRAAIVGLDVAALENPVATKGWQAFLNTALERRISPGSGTVVNTNGFIDFDVAVEALGVGLADLAHRHAEF